MKNVMVYNFQPHSKHFSFQDLEIYLKAQIDIALSLGWKFEDILCIGNFEYTYRGISMLQMDMNKSCLTGSKTFTVRAMIDKGMLDNGEVIWAHDIDLWQNAPFIQPEFKDMGICTYSTPTFNGGSVFYRKEAADMLDAVIKRITDEKAEREEPAINNVIKSNKEYLARTTILNSTYNVGCSGYRVRYAKAEKPLKGVHFHPTNRIAWDTHARNRNGISVEATISPELRKVLVQYFGKKISRFAYEDAPEKGPFDIREKGIDRKKAEGK